MNGPNDLFARGLVPLVVAAERSGLWGALARTPQDADALASRCGLSARAVALVLDALAATGACARTEQGYARDEGSLGGWPWTELESFLASGTPVAPIDAPERRGEVYRLAVDYLAERFGEPARALAAELPARGRVLDLGCGSAVWSLAMLSVGDSESRLVALDLPEVVAAVPARAAAAGLGSRVTTLAGSYFEAAPAGRFERVVMANVLHLETPDDAARLVTRYAPLLAANGELVIIDALAGASFEEELGRAFYAAHLGMRTARGGVHSPECLTRWCAQAGLQSVRLVKLGRYAPLGALVARAKGA